MDINHGDKVKKGQLSRTEATHDWFTHQSKSKTELIRVIMAALNFSIIIYINKVDQC